MEYRDVGHEGLGKFRRIVGAAGFAADLRAATLGAVWERQWQRRKTAEAAIPAPALQALKKLQAMDASEDAEAACVALTSILLDAVRASKTIDWNGFIDQKAFGEAPPAPPPRFELAGEPQASEARFTPPKLPLMARLFHPRRSADQTTKLKTAFADAREEWKATVLWRTQEHAETQRRYDAALADWDARRGAFHAAQSRANARIAELQKRYAANDIGAIAAACDYALLAAPRPESFPKFWRIGFDAAHGVMTVDYELPAPDDLPGLKAVRYAPERDAFERVALSEREAAALYEEAVYQTCLAVLHLMFAADPGETVRRIAFNGWVNFVDRLAGCPARVRLISLGVDKAAFAPIDLTSVDPKSCFRTLHGTAGARLADLEAVPPAGG
jgi:restriction system protein